MIVKGSINYTPSGRKRKVIRRKKKEYEFKELKTFPKSPERKHYPSVATGVHSTAKVCYPTVHGATVSVPYNKGAYQVIPKSEIKYIGK